MIKDFLFACNSSKYVCKHFGHFYFRRAWNEVHISHLVLMRWKNLNPGERYHWNKATNCLVALAMSKAHWITCWVTKFWFSGSRWLRTIKIRHSDSKWFAAAVSWDRLAEMAVCPGSWNSITYFLIMSNVCFMSNSRWRHLVFQMDAVNKEDNLKTPSYFYIVFLVNSNIHFGQTSCFWAWHNL